QAPFQSPVGAARGPTDVTPVNLGRPAVAKLKNHGSVGKANGTRGAQEEATGIKHEHEECAGSSVREADRKVTGTTQVNLTKPDNRRNQGEHSQTDERVIGNLLL